MRKIVVMLLLLGTLPLSGCFRHNYFDTSAVPEPVPSHWSWNHHLLWGIVGIGNDLPLDLVCPKGVARIETEMGILQVLLSVITSGIYTPTRVIVWCKAETRPYALDVRVDAAMVAALEQRFPDLEERLRSLDLAEREAPIEARFDEPAAVASRPVPAM